MPLVGMDECFGSTCHGAGRAQSRNKSRRALSYQDVLGKLAEQGIAIRVASPKLVRWRGVTKMDSSLQPLSMFQYPIPNSCFHFQNHDCKAVSYPWTTITLTLFTPPILLNRCRSHPFSCPCPCLPSGDGGGPGELQGRKRGGEHLPRRRHIQKSHQAQTHRRGKRIAATDKQTTITTNNWMPCERQHRESSQPQQTDAQPPSPFLKQIFFYCTGGYHNTTKLYLLLQPLTTAINPSLNQGHNEYQSSLV